jgi:UPF0716 protein FxsA
MSFPVRVPGGLRWFLVGWVAAEVVAFAAVVHLLGLGGTLLLIFLTTVLGVAMLRRIGTDASRNLRRAMTGREPPNGALLDGMLNALGAMLLILPGFVSNAVGCALAAPSVRGWAMRLFGGRSITPAAGPRGRQSASPDVIDLGPDDWKSVDPR